MEITRKSQNDIQEMKKSGQIAASILNEVAEAAKPGVSTWDLNELAEELVAKNNVKAAFKGYTGFPAALCTSVNEIIVHGVPKKEEILQEGDVLGLDFGVIYNGWYSDTAVTVGVGNVSHEAKRLMKVCKKALRLGIKKAKPDNTVGDIGNTIQRYVEDEGYEVVEELVGHGVGRDLHEDPAIPNHGKRKTGPILKPGMVVAIEPMIVAGTADLELHVDQFSYQSKHKHLTAHFEHTVAILEKGNEVLTKV